MLQKFFGALLLIFAVFSIGSYTYLTKTYPELPIPLTGRYFIESLIFRHRNLDKKVIGFLPYWQNENASSIRLSHLSEVNYFSLTPGADGKLLTVNDGITDPGWKTWQSDEIKELQAKANLYGTDVSIAIAALDNNLIINILDSEEAQQNLIDDIIKEVKERRLQGINIDFEYFGQPDPEYRTAFTNFSKQLNEQLDKEAPGTELSISIMPLAAREYDLFDFPKIVPVYDAFIGMSYDYYGASADFSGPVAPMKGFESGRYFFDVETTYKDFLKYIPKEKIVMGVPYYGWERSVLEAKTENSLVYATENEKNYAAVISYARAKEGKLIKKEQCKWEPIAQETWCWFKDPETNSNRQAWISDNRSVEIRFDYATKQQFVGVAIWTLGYDEQHLDLSDMISKKFTDQ